MRKQSLYTRLALSIILFSIFIYIGCKKDVDPTITGSDIGTMTIDPGQVIAGQNVKMNVYFTLNPEVTLSGTASELTLIQIDPSGSRSELTILYDNGDLNNYDEIKGDNVFTTSFIYNSDKEGEHQFIISTKIIDDKGNAKETESTPFKFSVFKQLAAGALSGILKTQDDAANVFQTAVAGSQSNILFAVDQTINWLKSQANIQDAVKSSAGISITYKSGISAALVISVEDPVGGYTLGFANDKFPPRNKIPIPLSQQTRGNTKKLIEMRGEDISADLIGNKKVLIFDPYQALLSPINGASKAEIKKILTESKCGKYEVVDMSNTDASVDVVSSFTQYGFILMTTHGLGGETFGTGEYVDSNHVNFSTKYQPLLLAKKIAVWKNIQVGVSGNVAINKDVYAINSSFIRDLNGRFPNSLIVNMSCEGTKTKNLFNAYASKGAKAYVGFSEVVYSDFASMVWQDVIETVIKDSKTIGEIKNKGVVDTKGYGNPLAYARADVLGLETIKLPNELINGSFEAGLKGWTSSGDGRYISSLGNLLPSDKDFAAIISTGLGFTTSSGSVYQSFTVPADAKSLTYDWILLSEEYLEYIGSQYQDKFEVVIKDDTGTENIIFSKTIDQLAADYGATKDLPGSLIPASPAIVFDHGDVYRTSLVNNLINLTDYQGKCITLEFRCTDVGDSSFDTAILIDNVKITK